MRKPLSWLFFSYLGNDSADRKARVGGVVDDV